MTSHPRLAHSLTAGLLACVLAGTAPALAGPGTADRSGDDRPTNPANHVDEHALQSSDGDPGVPAPQVPFYRRGYTERRTTIKKQVSPGVTYTQFDIDDARGPNRVYLLAIKTRTPGLKLDYAAQSHITRTAPILKTLQIDHAVAGVNGDFYDIGDTGAPLGLGKDRQRGVLHGRLAGWNSAFYLDAKGKPQIGTLALHARITQHPKVSLTNVNSPFVAPGGIGVYTSAWGPTRGYRVTDGQTRDVRMVKIRGGRVVASTTTLGDGQVIQGNILIGRDAGARALAKLRIGSRASVRWRLDQDPQVAISGNQFLIDDGVVRVDDDKVMEPRTAVGIDRDTHEVLLMVVDGRQSFSRGMTMVELADLMGDLGADEALNLDGGGSSTLVARGPAGLGVVNSPSDGFQRWVADGLEVTYTKPKKTGQS